MQILLIEAVLSGLFRNVNSSILSEGFAMVSSLTRDFSNAGYNVSVSICKNFLKLFRFLKYSNVRKITVTNFLELKRLAQLHDLTYVIAPESNGLLAHLLEELDGFHVCSNHEVVRRISDKAVVMSELSKMGLKTPQTLIYTPYTLENQLELDDLKPPFIVKPRTGTGCDGLKLFKSLGELKRFLSSRKREFLIQEFVKGVPASVSLLTDGSRALPISLNRQFVSISRSMYLGGYTPMKHKLLNKAFETAVKAVEAFRGLRGYIGVDVILSKNGVYVVEINPRLTVSYVGLSRSLSENPSNTIIETGLGKTCKFNPSFKAVCYFKKALFEDSIFKRLKHVLGFSDVMASPPIPVESRDKAYGFIVATSDNFTNARIAYFKILEKLQREIGCKISW